MFNLTSNDLGNKRVLFVVLGFSFFSPLRSLLYPLHKELELLSGGVK